MEERSAWLIGRNAIVAGVAAIALNPLAIFVGYQISTMLASPEFAVEYVNVDPQTDPIPLQSDTFKFVSGNGLLYTLIINKLPEWCSAWIKTGKIEKHCIDAAMTAVEAVLRHIDSEIDVHERNIKTLQAWDGKSELDLAPPITFEFRDLVTYAYNNKERALSISRMLLRSTQTFRKKTVELSDEIKALEGVKEARTEDVIVGVGILNSGDSDGAVMPEAELQFGDKILPLIQWGAAPAEYAVIKAHSFSEARYIVNEKTRSSDAWESWRALVTNRIQEPFQIRLMTSGGEVAASGRLPP